MAQKIKINSDGRWRSLAVIRYFWQMARPRIASLFLVNSDCFLFLWILTKFCTRATSSGAAIFKLNASIFLKQMWLTHTHTVVCTHTHTLTTHCRWRNSLWEASFLLSLSPSPFSFLLSLLLWEPIDGAIDNYGFPKKKRPRILIEENRLFSTTCAGNL